MDFLFENLFVFIPLIFFLILRAAFAKKPGPKERQPGYPPAAPARNRAEERRSPLDELSFLLGEDRPVSQAAPSMPPRPREAPRRPVRPGPPPAIETPSLLAEAPAPPPARKESPRFPQSLEYLPPLQRALVLSEILGPPKSLPRFTEEE